MRRMGSREQTIRKIKIMHTSDVHGSLFTHDFVENGPSKGALSKIYAAVKREREKPGQEVILLDAGDILQGQPTAYYCNFVDTDRRHLVAECMNFMEYDALCIGNHDLEMGHAVYDRFVAQCNFPVLAANLVHEADGSPYFKPYCIIERGGVKVAVLGLTTCAIPHWVPYEQWKGIRILDIMDSARQWVNHILEKEAPDLLVGLFHTGWDGGIVTENFRENAVRQIASGIDGIDIICYGHDHNKRIETLVNDFGHSVYCVGVWSQATCFSSVDVLLEYRNNKVCGKRIRPRVRSSIYEADSEVFAFERHFSEYSSLVAAYVNQKIGTLNQTLYSRDAYFGPSAFIDLIHEIQLKISDADISFAAPLAFNTLIEQGDLYVRDMFQLYKYENMLCVLRLKGSEIKSILEQSYTLWTETMKSEDDLFLKIQPLSGFAGRWGFVNLAFNFDSAAGIRYQVDVTRPDGNKITIESMADGSPFSSEKYYRVVTNSFRGNGGGELFTCGAGLTHGELQDRILFTSEKDMRYYFIEYIQSTGLIDVRVLNHWRFVPVEWVRKASERDRERLFGNGKR